MAEPRLVPLSQGSWEDDVPGIRDCVQVLDGVRWAIVEYAENARREEWCEDGHRGYVISGSIEYEFSNGHAPLRAHAGDAFMLPAGVAHRGQNRADGATRLFLIDD